MHCLHNLGEVSRRLLSARCLARPSGLRGPLETGLRTEEKWNANLVLVENKASGIGFIEVINQKGTQPWLMWLGPEKGKVERAQQQTVKFEQGRIWLPTEAPWLAPYEAELF